VGISYEIRVYHGTYLASIINKEFFPNNKNLKLQEAGAFYIKKKEEGYSEFNHC